MRNGKIAMKRIWNRFTFMKLHFPNILPKFLYLWRVLRHFRVFSLLLLHSTFAVWWKTEENLHMKVTLLSDHRSMGTVDARWKCHSRGKEIKKRILRCPAESIYSIRIALENVLILRCHQAILRAITILGRMHVNGVCVQVSARI